MLRFSGAHRSLTGTASNVRVGGALAVSRRTASVRAFYNVGKEELLAVNQEAHYGDCDGDQG